ncbi:MAG: efflux RND transporter periplasmic adaptor subunit [bacterium]|nr:efflux RND transporter periplasmic adaptor subunit [bacterium]
MLIFLKRPLTIVFILVLLGAGGAFIVFTGSGDVRRETIEVTLRDITQEVAVTGRVGAVKFVELAFEKVGRISGVHVQVGSRVVPGSLLVSLDSAELSANLAEAKADVRVQESKLQELERGTRAEELEVARVKVQNAESAVKDTRQQVLDTLQGSYTKSDDGVRNKADQVFSNPRSSSPQLLFIASDSQLESIVEVKRAVVESILTSWKVSLDILSLDSDFNKALLITKQNLGEIQSFLGDLAFAINGAFSMGSTTTSTFNSWKSDVFTARTNVNTAIANVSSIEESLQLAESNVSLEKQNLILLEAGTAPEEIAAQQARLEQSRATAVKIETQVEKSRLYSPIFGIVTKQTAKVGELVASAVNIVSLISENDFEIETYVPEADIAKIEVGNTAKVTLDAYGRGVMFEARVVAIDPAETIIEGVATYKVTLLFSAEDERIKSGMTANITIVGAKKDGVFAVPQRAIITRGNSKVVRVITGEVTQEVEVTLGLRGSDGFVEITEGLNEGDIVITFLEGE